MLVLGGSVWNELDFCKGYMSLFAKRNNFEICSFQATGSEIGLLASFYFTRLKTTREVDHHKVAFIFTYVHHYTGQYLIKCKISFRTKDDNWKVVHRVLNENGFF